MSKKCGSANPDARKQKAVTIRPFHLLGEDSRPLSSRRWRDRRARFLHFEFAELESQGDPLLGESFEFLVVGELLAHLGNKLRTNELSGALAAMGVAQLVKGAMFFGVDGIHALAPRLLTGRVLLG